MADPICRWRNPYVSTIIELVKVLPHEVMPSDKFRTIVEKSWPGFLHTPYQLACQVGLYYESDNGLYYPRFDHDINETEAFSYMKRWITRYYVPNPYTKSMKTLQQPQPFLASIIGYIYKHPDDTELHSILEAVFQEKIGNIDIISNVLNTYTDLIKVDTLGNVELTVKAIDFMKQYLDRNDKKAFFDYFSEGNNTDNSISKNLILYGAPGTGKSHRIKEDDGVKKAEESNLVFRTTFHPDSDYSTFVGAYKPTMQPVADKYKAVAGKDEEITYSFVPQAFLQAYVAAWNNPEENVYLVIEEINRGNCAQIFGDLFQLLDRDCDGFSEYPIMADNDLRKYLNGKDEEGKDVLTNKDGIKDGKLRLPKNLYIWATMNTSDQSLFPIDSAFKRRWDWVYVPIDTAKDTWYIKIENNYYSWTEFLDKVNDELLTDETAEDKHLGFYFCKATEKKEGTESDPNVITAETFVGKVLFYLWNDVFKVYGIPSSIGSSKDWPYRKFYQTDGKVDQDKVVELMKKLGVENTSYFDDSSDEENDDDETNDENVGVRLTVSFPDGTTIDGDTKFESYSKALEKIGLSQAAQIASEKQYHRLNCALIDTVQREAIQRSNRLSYVKIGDYYLVKGMKGKTMRNMLRLISEKLHLNLDIHYQ